MNKTYRQTLDSAAGLYIPDDVNLIPRVVARLNQRRSFIQTLRARPALAIFLAILLLLLLTGAAYAIGKLTGYIPGVGLIDQSIPLRVLAEPVTVTRDGITMIVERAILSADKTIVVVKTEGVPMAAYPKNEGDGGCQGQVDLRLSDGTLLEGGYLNGGNWSPFRSNLEYGPVPTSVSAATLQIACIGGTVAGALPANWEVPIRFAPAPPDMTVVPVIDVSTPTVPSEATAEPAPAHLERALQIGNDYILMGRWDSTVPEGWLEPAYPDLTDAKGQKIVASMPTIQGLPAYDWSVQFNGAGLAYPITLSFTGRTIHAVPDAAAEFVFDAGDDPQPGQQWIFNKDFDMAGHTVRLVSITVTGGNGGGGPQFGGGGGGPQFGGGGNGYPGAIALSSRPIPM